MKTSIMIQRIYIYLCLGLALIATNVQAEPNPSVELKTSFGIIVIELYPENAPKTVANFTQYVKDGFYNGTIFHRVIPGFMVQGGGFTAALKEKPTRPAIQSEAGNGLRNAIGTVAMARTADPHSATAQFFINVTENDFLDFQSADEKGYGYTVFGRVRSGMDVVEKIVKVPTATRGSNQNVPVQPITIDRVRMLDSPKNKSAAKK